MGKLHTLRVLNQQFAALLASVEDLGIWLHWHMPRGSCAELSNASDDAASPDADLETAEAGLQCRGRSFATFATGAESYMAHTRAVHPRPEGS